MPKAVQRKAAKRGGKPSRRAARNGVKPADFCAAARDALKRGEPDAISDKTLQQVLTAAVKVYAAKVERRGEGRWSVRGCGIGSLLAPRAPLDFGNSGTGMRLMMGVAGGHAITATFDGDASLRKRPMRRILEPLCAM